MVLRGSRLARTTRTDMIKRRLDFVTEKRELIKDILALGGEENISFLEDELCAWGESVDEILPMLSLPRLRRIHARVVLGKLPPAMVEE